MKVELLWCNKKVLIHFYCENIKRWIKGRHVSIVRCVFIAFLPFTINIWNTLNNHDVSIEAKDFLFELWWYNLFLELILKYCQKVENILLIFTKKLEINILFKTLHDRIQSSSFSPELLCVSHKRLFTNSIVTPVLCIYLKHLFTQYFSF